MAIEELKKIELEAEELQNKLQLLLLPKDPNDKSNLFIEIRAGTGGEEAALFAGDLMRMYVRYAEIRKWEIEYISVSESDLEGYKEVIMRVIGDGAYSRLKFESGAHRVQRVPETESQGRIHTSACTVAILPEVELIDEVDINTADLRIDTFRASGAGGQHVNKTDSAVRITHMESGTVVQCQNERSQLKNKNTALKMLKAKLYQHKMEEMAASQDKLSREKKEIGWGSQIRSYVFHPYNMVKDHRTKYETSNIQAVMDGDIDNFIRTYLLAKLEQ